MKNIEFFKKQAKDLLKDWNSRQENPGTNDEFEGEPFVFDAKFFDMYNMIQNFDFGDDFCLQRAQHIIAQMAGFSKWDDLQKSNEDELALARIQFLHIDFATINSWKKYRDSNEWEIIPIKARFRLAKKYAYLHRSNYLLHTQFKNEILHGIERQVAIDDEYTTGDTDTYVRCIHCGEQYKVNEATAIHVYDFFGIGEHDMIYCKNYPNCDGSLIDLLSDPEFF